MLAFADFLTRELIQLFVNALQVLVFALKTFAEFQWRGKMFVMYS